MRVAWCTDIHLDFLDERGFERFSQEIEATKCDALLAGGDISTARDLRRHLQLLAERLARPIYFVLGNHDFYRGSVREVRNSIRDLPSPRYLPNCEPIDLGDGVGLAGCDGWGDARIGNRETQVLLNDFRLIDELSMIPRALTGGAEYGKPRIERVFDGQPS